VSVGGVCQRRRSLTGLVAMFPPAVVFLNAAATIGQLESKNPFFRTNGLQSSTAQIMGTIWLRMWMVIHTQKRRPICISMVPAKA
jgi:hypothetical protein